MSQNPQKENNEEGNPSDVNLFDNSKEKKKSSLKSFVGSDYYKNFSDFKNSSDSEVSKKRANSLKDKEYKFDDFNLIREKIKDEKRKTISSIKDKGSEPFITLSFSKNFEKQLIDAFSMQSTNFQQNMQMQYAIFQEEMKVQSANFQQNMKDQSANFQQNMENQSAIFQRNMENQSAKFQQNMENQSAKFQQNMEKQSAKFQQNMEKQSAIFRNEMKDQTDIFRKEMKDQTNTFLESLKAGFLLQSENFEKKLIAALNLQSMKQKEEIKNDSDRPNENGNSNIQKGPTAPQ